MAITTSAKKAIRVAANKHIFNLRHKRAVHDVLSQIKKLVAAKKTSEAQRLLSRAYQAIDKSKKRGVIKKNNAARKKSSLAKMVTTK